MLSKSALSRLLMQRSNCVCCTPKASCASTATLSGHKLVIQIKARWRQRLSTSTTNKTAGLLLQLPVCRTASPQPVPQEFFARK